MTIRDIQHGFRLGVRQWRTAAIVYVIQLCMALTLGMQVYDVLHASIGHSLEIHKLLVGYDHTVMTDFLKVHGASITPLIGQLRWILLLWLLFAVFLDAGLLANIIRPAEASWKLFWQGAAAYFFPFLKISLIFLLLLLLWTALIFIPLGAFLSPALQYFSSEKYVVWMVLAALFLWMLGLGVLFAWSVLSRLVYIKAAGTPVWKCINSARKTFFQRKMHHFSLLACFAMAQLLLLAIYWLIEGATGMRSPLLIVLVFGIQQTFVFFRIQLRQMMYSLLELGIRN